MTRMRLLVVLLSLVLGAAGIFIAACGGEQDVTTTAPTVSTTGTASGEPFRIGVNLGYTGPMAAEAAVADHGIRTALEQVGYQVLGRPIELYTVDNESDPVTAVEQTLQLVEDKKVDVILGPLSPPSNAAVTMYLGRTSGTPCISLVGEPAENLGVANDVAVIPPGLYSAQGYYLGRYASQVLGYATANVISQGGTTSGDMAAGFSRAFVTEGGGQILNTQSVPVDTLDFSSYLAAPEQADVTVLFMSGGGVAAFVRQYRDSGLSAPLIMGMAHDLPELSLNGLGDLSLDIVATDHYVPLIDDPLNAEFVDDYAAQWGGESPTIDSFGGWIGVNIFLAAVKKTDGDTTPEMLLEAMSTLSLDTPAGVYTMSPYQRAYIGTGNLYICRSARIGQRIAWNPAYTYEQVLFEAKD